MCTLLRPDARTADQKYLIAISDGLPCTRDDGPGSGVDATKEAVTAARREGWKVVSVGIGDAFCEQIYGERWTIRIDDADHLPQGFCNLLIRLLRNCG